MYSDKPIIKLYKYTTTFTLQALIDDYASISIEHNLYSAGQFTIEINYNIPNALLFERGMFVQIGDSAYDFGEIVSVTDTIGTDGKGSQVRTITGYDARYIFKRRVVRNLNADSTWSMTASGELCMRNLIADQCGENAETKRRLPVVNTIGDTGLGDEYTVSVAYDNLYDTLETIATQSGVGWRLAFDRSAETQLTLEVYQGEDKSSSIQFSADYDSLADGEFTDTAESYCNAVYVGGKGTGTERDIYEGENAIDDASPAGLDRYEAWDNQSSMTTESEYTAEAESVLTQYGQTLTLSGNGLAKCPYIFREQYDIGDTITVSFSGKSAAVQVLSVTEHWAWGTYEISFDFGKPVNDLGRQLNLILNQIQVAATESSSTDSVKWYTIPTDTAMASSEVVYNTIGFKGVCASGGSTFALYRDNEGTGAKTYHVYVKQLTGDGLTLTTGVSGASTVTLTEGTYVQIIYVDTDGNVKNTADTVSGDLTVTGTINGTLSSASYGFNIGFTWASGYSGVFLIESSRLIGNRLLILNIAITNVSGTNIGTFHTATIGTCNLNPVIRAQNAFIDYAGSSRQIRVSIDPSASVNILESMGVVSGSNNIRGCLICCLS